MNPHAKSDASAFTLIELLVVIAIIAILAAILLPVLTRAQQRAQFTYCMNNLKQLQMAIEMYADDNHQYFPENDGTTITSSAWVTGVLDWDFPPGYGNTQNTNTSFLIAGQIGPYVSGRFAIFKCPADTVPSRWGTRVRSYSMNGFVGDDLNISAKNSPGWKRFLKTSDCLRPGPAMTFVLLDECPDSINDGFFAPATSGTAWIDVPASTHNGAGGFSFADGHAEIKSWLDPNSKAPVMRVNPCPENKQSAPRDVAWVQQHASSQ